MSPKDNPPNHINFWLKKLDVSQGALGAAVGVTQQQIAKLANGERPLTDEMLLKMSRHLDVEPADLLKFDISLSMEKVMVRGVATAGVWRDKPFRDKEEYYLVELPIDSRHPGKSRYGMESEAKNGGGIVEIVTLVDVSKLQHAQEIGKRYLVQRQDEFGRFEMSIRRLRQADDGGLWLLAENAEPRFMAPIPYYEGSPTIKILALVTASYRTE